MCHEYSIAGLMVTVRSRDHAQLSTQQPLTHSAATLRTERESCAGRLSVDSEGAGRLCAPTDIINVVGGDIRSAGTASPDPAPPPSNIYTRRDGGGRVGDGAMAHGQPDVSHMYASAHPPPSYSCSAELYPDQSASYLATSTCAVSYHHHHHHHHPAAPSYSSAPKPPAVQDGALLSLVPDYGGFYPPSCQQDPQGPSFPDRKSLPYPLESLRMPPPPPLTPLNTIRNFTLHAAPSAAAEVPPVTQHYLCDVRPAPSQGSEPHQNSGGWEISISHTSEPWPGAAGVVSVCARSAPPIASSGITW
ncbi:hypothetical protein CRUP_026837 [Coryphaenoides rupestris]|nr:hypothetical protein CRUP_026837 [Coryphaenoides rupestris]